VTKNEGVPRDPRLGGLLLTSRSVAKPYCGHTMHERPLYDRAIFWLGLGGSVAAIGGIVLGVGVAQVVAKQDGNLWANPWFDAGLAILVCGAGMLGWALQLYLRHSHTKARFEVVSAEWECEPPLTHSPVDDPRTCSAHVVLINRGGAGNGVLTVHYVGFGRAGDEYPERQGRIVIPATSTGAYVEVRCPVGSVPPLRLEHPPKIEVMPASKSQAAAQAAPRGPAQPVTRTAGPYVPSQTPDSAQRSDIAMGLMTFRKLEALKDVSLVTLLNDNPAVWKTKAQHAFDATRPFIKEIRPGDVTALLTLQLEVTPEFRNYLAQKKLRQKYWTEWFAELIIDQYWSELKRG
jgi:hypothetical protein